MCSFRQSNHPQKVAQRCFAPARQETEWYVECHSLLLHIKWRQLPYLSVIFLPEHNLFLIGNTLGILMSKFESQISIYDNLSSHLGDCRLDPFAVLDAPRSCGTAVEKLLDSFESVDVVARLRSLFVLVLHCLSLHELFESHLDSDNGRVGKNLIVHCFLILIGF